MIFTYHASHEQFSPSHLVQLSVLAEKHGFDAIHSSDHFYPWSERQGQSGHVFSWLGAAMQATTLPFSTVCAPGQRYHPAIAAQAIATLAEMFPGRFICVELGSGEALNERITGEPWPEKKIRNERLKECALIIRRMLAGDEVSFEGTVKVNAAKLYTLPETVPLLFCAALSEETSTWAAEWADGLLTVSGDADAVDKRIRAFRKVAGSDKPAYVKYSFSFHPEEDEAIDGAFDQWRNNLVAPDKLADLAKPEQFDEVGNSIKREEIKNQIPIYTDLGQLMNDIALFKELQIDNIILHNVNRHQELFIEHYGRWKVQQ